MAGYPGAFSWAPPLVNERVGIFVSCFALLLGVAPAAPGHRRWLRLRIVVAVAVLLGIHLWRSHGFAGEIRGFDQVVERDPPRFAGLHVALASGEAHSTPG